MQWKWGHTTQTNKELTLKKKTDLGHLTEGRPFGNVDYPADKLYDSEFSGETEPIGYVNI